MKFRDLRADEIDVRIGSFGKSGGASLLLYKDARCDMIILDEAFTPFGWTRNHEVVNGNLFANVCIYDENKKQWVCKQDVGVESNAEKEKGEASDSFKRACFNWGIGRKLYTAPFIWVKGAKDSLKYEKFYVSDIKYDDNKITELVIKNLKSNKVVFSTKGNVDKNENDKISENQYKTIKGLLVKDIAEKHAELSKEEKNDKYTSYIDAIKKEYKVKEIKELTCEQASALITRMTKKSKK